MSKDIRLSPKHGLNPTIPTCFYCNKPKNEVIIPGLVNTRNEHDVKMPMHSGVWNLEPCDECKGYMEQGIILISVRATGNPEERKNPYRTGGWCVVTEDAVKRWFDPVSVENILKRRVAFVDDATWALLELPHPTKEQP